MWKRCVNIRIATRIVMEFRGRSNTSFVDTFKEIVNHDGGEVEENDPQWWIKSSRQNQVRELL